MFKLEVVVTQGVEVTALKARVAELEALLDTATARANRAEYLFRCESQINQELVDVCRASGVKFRAALERRPF